MGGQALDKGTGTGKLSQIAIKCLMKIMYIARFARPDLLRAVGALTTMITKWDDVCDRKLCRITEYMNGSAAWRQIGFIGDTPDELELGLFSDADFAGDRETMWSTSGVFLAVHTALTVSVRSQRRARSRLLLAIAQSRPKSRSWRPITHSG